MSTRRMLLVLLLLQVAVALAIGAALMRHAGTAAWLALAAGFALVLLVRLLITANNFFLSARFASPTPGQFRIGPAGRLRLFAEEFMATMLHSSWFMARARAHCVIYPDSPVAPVLLLHGYGCNSGYWVHLSRRLGAARISHATLDLEPLMAGIDDYLPQVQGAVAALCQASGARQVTIVAHSMGGLVARAFLSTHGAAQVAHVFTLGTPHHGTGMASFGPGRNAAQMRRASGQASEWLRTLAATESSQTRGLITSLYTHHDNIIAPQTSSVLPGARNLEFGGIGHVALGCNRRILDTLLHEIAMIVTR